MERRARSQLVASRRLITPTTSPEKLGDFRRKTGKETTFAPYFSPGIPKFHGNLSFASGKLPSPVARSPTLESPLRNLINFTTPKSGQPAQNTYFCNMNTSNAEIITQQWFAGKWKPRPADGHKGTFGHLLLIAGHEGMIGAAVLAARSALRSGVGKVTVHIPRCGRDVLQVAVPEAVLQVDESSESCWSSLIDLTGFTAVAVGPGLGTDGETAFALRALLKALLERETIGTPLPLILDADALNLLATDYQLLSLVPPHSLLTPHLGEIRRLCRALDLPCEELADLQVAARMLSDSLRLNLLLKDHIPHLFIPEGRLLVAEGGGNSALAKAGSGDVLTGLIGGLAAQGYLPEEAAGLGVCLHREAGKWPKLVIPLLPQRPQI